MINDYINQLESRLTDVLRSRAKLHEQRNELLAAVQMAYRKHHMMDGSVGWDELSGVLLNALCEAMGNTGYQEWVAKVRL